MSNADWDEARLLWADGFDTKDIADQFGVTEGYVYKNISALYGDYRDVAA